ncbi:MAG: AMED_5909 family protein [Pseudonocardiaceae bacterium]
MTGDKTAKPGPPRTLMQAHEELVRIRPRRDASLAAWLAYYQRSAALYAELAEIDRGHHHECLYWAERERESAEEVTAQIRAEGRK